MCSRRPAPEALVVGVPRLLPTRTTIAPDEALDSFLERLAAANDLQPAQLLRLLRTPGDERSRLAFFMVKPDPTILTAIASISGVGNEKLREATLARFGDGLPLRFNGFDPRDRHSYRNVIAQGWFPTTGSQVCSPCLSERGSWRIEWRLPLAAVCTHHRTFLTFACQGCGRRFRSHHHSPLRAIIGPDHPCGNPLGLRNPCRHSVIDHHPQAAPIALVDSASGIARALSGEPIPMLGVEADAQTYLAELRHLATLLLHLASRAGAPSVVAWADEVHAEARTRSTTLRGPRWGYSPPQDSRVRGHVLDTSARTLAEGSIQSAGARLAPWIDLIAAEGNGPSVWMLNRTTRTPIMEQLIHAATEGRHHVGRRLTKMSPSNVSLAASSIPQLFDEDLFHELFDGMLGGYDRTRRLYVSLCVVRAAAAATTWSEAAGELGLAPRIGPATARAASKLMQVSPEQFARAVHRAIQLLPRDRDFRARELRVQTLARQSDGWFPQWCISSNPARRTSSLPYAVTWMWCQVSQGCFDTSPAWSASPSRHLRAAYVAFRDRLPRPQQELLQSLVLTVASD